MGVAFWFFSEEDPVVAARRQNNEKPTSAWLELEPLKNIQVWRFALYYFFVFGAFVALSLWLPQYLIKVYGVDIKTAGMMAAHVLVPGQRVPRLWRPSFGPLRRTRASCIGRSWSAVVATFLLSYPPTDYVVQNGHRRDRLPPGDGAGRRSP